MAKEVERLLTLTLTLVNPPRSTLTLTRSALTLTLGGEAEGAERGAARCELLTVRRERNATRP